MALEFIPYEMPAYDGHQDISDVWQEETDAENERGELCTAYFDDWTSGHGCRSALVAIRVSGIDGNKDLILPRDLAMVLLNPMTVTRIERNRADRLDEEEAGL